MKFCPKMAIYIAIPPKKTEFGDFQGGKIIGGCCNNWLCPVCGEKRAKQEYARIVEGCKELHRLGLKLYLLTLTTKGSDMPLLEAEETYLTWTNRLLTALRKDSHKRKLPWYYVQVTERQKRGHPHSHLITSYFPQDLQEGEKLKFDRKLRRYTYQHALVSTWLEDRCISAGMGEQYDVSPIISVVGAAKYCAKYLFKSLKGVEYPSGWKRVRYSQSFPKIEKTNTEAFPLINKDDWLKLGAYDGYWTCYDRYSYEQALKGTLRYVRLEIGESDNDR